MAITEIVEKTLSIPGQIWMDLESSQDYDDYRTWLAARLREAYPGAEVYVARSDFKAPSRIVSDAPTEAERLAEIEEVRRTIGGLMVRWLREKPHRVDATTATVHVILALVGFAAGAGGLVFGLIATGVLIFEGNFSNLQAWGSAALTLLCGYVYFTLQDYAERQEADRLGTGGSRTTHSLTLPEIAAVSMIIAGISGLVFGIPMLGLVSGPGALLRGLAASLAGGAWLLLLWLRRSGKATTYVPEEGGFINFIRRLWKRNAGSTSTDNQVAHVPSNDESDYISRLNDNLTELAETVVSVSSVVPELISECLALEGKPGELSEDRARKLVEGFVKLNQLHKSAKALVEPDHPGLQNWSHDEYVELMSHYASAVAAMVLGLEKGNTEQATEAWLALTSLGLSSLDMHSRVIDAGSSLLPAQLQSEAIDEQRQIWKKARQKS